MDQRTHRLDVYLIKSQTLSPCALYPFLAFALAFLMPPEPTFSRSHLSAFRSSLMGTTTVVTKKTRPLSQQAARLTTLSCCHKQRHATRSQSESSPRIVSSNDDEVRRPASESQSCASSPASSSSSSSSLPSSPPQSHLSPVPGAEAKNDPDGTISPATIYQHYACVARRLFPVLAAERQRRVASSRPNSSTSAKTRPSALDWPLPTSVGPAPTLALDVTGATTMVALDELPVSANCELPEYQLTQEWFERIVSDLREVEESKAKAAAVAAADVVTDVDGDAEEEAEDKRYRKQLDW